MGFDWQHHPMVVVGMTDCQARDALSRIGMNFIVKGEASLPQGDGAIECELVGVIDDVIKRGLSKIAFNYLAYQEGCVFALQSDFDTIRSFIRYGGPEPYPLFRCIETPILADEPVEGLRRLGHVITVNTAADGCSIVAQVSLLNQMTYSVSLSKDYAGEPRNVTRGHFFDHGQRRIYDLGVVKRSCS